MRYFLFISPVFKDRLKGYISSLSLLPIFIICFVILNIQSATALGTLNFSPLTAYVFEPRTGAMYQFQPDKVRLDIGTSIDLATFPVNDKEIISIGGDFFTYTELRTAGNFKFPVETSDYYFGLNGAITYKSENREYSARLRLAHISSHLVDGLANGLVFTQMPFVFSREFVDAVGAFKIDYYRFYLGSMILFSTKPKNFLLINPQAGMDFDLPIMKGISLKAGYDFRLIGISGAYNGVNSAEAGFVFHTAQNAGFSVNLLMYQGKSMHGLFYNVYDSYIGAGFRIFYL
jgi:hypothetical protein